MRPSMPPGSGRVLVRRGDGWAIRTSIAPVLFIIGFAIFFVTQPYEPNSRVGEGMALFGPPIVIAHSTYQLVRIWRTLRHQPAVELTESHLVVRPSNGAKEIPRSLARGLNMGRVGPLDVLSSRSLGGGFRLYFSDSQVVEPALLATALGGRGTRK